MATTYPGTIDSFTNPAGTNFLSDSGVDHATEHTNANGAVIAVENTLGTTAGTSVLMNFGAGDFAARINSGGTLKQALTGTFSALAGTFNNLTFGTPTFTLGGDAPRDIYFRSAAGTMNRLPAGTAGQYLQTQGTGANPSWASASGVTLQVVSGTYATQGSTTSASLQDSGLAGTITPAGTASRIVVQFSMPTLVQGANVGGLLTLLRASTQIFTPITNFGYPTDQTRSLITATYVDSPGTTVAVTYKVQYKQNTGSGTVFVQADNSTSSIVLTELSS